MLTMQYFLLYLKIFRHGDRMIIDPYPNDPYKSPELWPNEFGQLTNVSCFFFNSLFINCT